MTIRDEAVYYVSMALIWAGVFNAAVLVGLVKIGAIQW